MAMPLERRESWRVTYRMPGTDKAATKTLRGGKPGEAERAAREFAAELQGAKVKRTVTYRARKRLKDGKEASKTFTRMKDAKAWLEEAGGRIRRNKAVEPSRELLGTYLKRWLKVDVDGGDLRANTAAQYRYSLEHYVIPKLGGIPLGDLETNDLKARYKEMRESGLSRRTIQLTNAVLHAALGDAEDGGLLLYNPAATALKKSRRGRRRRKDDGNGLSTRRAKKKAMLPDQLESFLKAAKGDTHEALFYFLARTGCRPSEALALRWADCNLTLWEGEPDGGVEKGEGEAFICRSVSRVGGEWYFEHTKTEESERVVPLEAGLVTMLKSHRKTVGERRLKAGPAWNHLDLVFPGPLGEPLDFAAVRRRHFNPICAAAGLADVEVLPAPERKGTRGPEPKPRKKIKPWFTPYSLRHTAATHMARAGTPPKVAAAVLGHADIATTLSFYTHSATDLERQAVRNLAKPAAADKNGPPEDPQNPTGTEKAPSGGG